MRSTARKLAKRALYENKNIHCWLGTKKGQKACIQDLPKRKKEFEERITKVSEIAEAERQKQLLKLYRKKPSDVVATMSNDPKKFDIVKNFIKRKGLKVYGGLAINAYLKSDMKIYKKGDIPDYDVFSPEPWDDAVELADIFYEQGYKYIEAKAGMHAGTYRVYVDFWLVADISYMPQQQYDMIKTKTINGMKFVEPFKLLESMYKEFSEPQIQPKRWPKVAMREKMLQATLEPFEQSHCSKNLFEKVNKTTKTNDILDKLLHESFKFCLKNKLLFTEDVAYNTYLEYLDADARIRVKKIVALSENANRTVKDILSVLLHVYEDLNVETTYKPTKELNDTMYNIKANIGGYVKDVCEIVQLSTCTPYKKIGNIYVVGIDYLKYDILHNIVFFYNAKQRNDGLCLLKYISDEQEKFYKREKVTEFDDTPLQRFVYKCRGLTQKGAKTSLLDRWNEKVEKMNETITTTIPNFKVKLYPIVKCGNSEETCSYPCSWDRYSKRCAIVHKTSYEPYFESRKK